MNLRFAPALFTALALAAAPRSAGADPPKASIVAPPRVEEAPRPAFTPLPSWAVYKTEFRSAGMMATGIIGGIGGTIAMGVGTGLWASDPCGNLEEIPVDAKGAVFSQCQGSASQTTGMIITFTSAIVVAVAIPLIIVGSQRVRVPRAPRAKAKAAAASFGVRPGPSGLSFVF